MVSQYPGALDNLNDATNPLLTHRNVTEAIESVQSTLGTHPIVTRRVGAATTGQTTLSGIQTIDGVAGSDGLLVLVKNQSARAENGVYRMKSGSWLRAEYADTALKMIGMQVVPDSGTINGGVTYAVVGWQWWHTLGSTGMYWENQGVIMAQAFASSVTLANAAFITLNIAEEMDTANMYNPSTGIYTAPVHGIYEMSGSIYWPPRAGAANHLLLCVFLNGNEYMRWSAPGAVFNTGQGCGGAFPTRITAGVTVEFKAYQDGGATMSTGNVSHMVKLIKAL